MADFPYLPLWTDAFLADTVHLDNRESGAYLLLLVASWRIGGALPNNDTKLARYAKCSPREWQRVRAAIMPFWTVDENGGLFQKRLEVERMYVTERSAKARSAAHAKWLKERRNVSAGASAKHMLNGHSADALIPTPIPRDTLSESLTVAARGSARVDGSAPRALASILSDLAKQKRPA